MKTRKKSSIFVAFALMSMLARPQLAFAQVTPDPIIGSWERLKAIPPGDKVEVDLRNGQTLKGKLINISDTALTIEQAQRATDISRGAALRVHRMVSKSSKRATLIGLGIGAGVGLIGSVAAAKSGGGEGDADLGALIVGAIGAGAGALIGYIVGSRNQQSLIYETR
jgi:outer membrane lipoprotein SlyB